MSFGFDNTTTEGKFEKKYVTIDKIEDFVQKGKISKLEIPEDQRWLHVEFTSESGGTTNKNFFFPQDTGDKEKYDKSVKFFLANMANIGRRYKGTNYAVSGNTLLEVAQKVIRDITPLLNKPVYCLLELNEGKDGKIYTNVGSFSPFSDNGTDLFVTQKQKDMFAKKGSYKPDTDVKPASNDDFANASFNMPDAPVIEGDMPF